MYFPQFDMASGELTAMELVPMKIEKFQLNNASSKDVKWLQARLNREGAKFGTEIELREPGSLWLTW